ncbi:MAG: hypothetical protein ACREIV_08675, partial [Planctomycetaceae bacterium]
KRWLNGRELLLSALLLLIPYATMTYDNLMLSQPRFAAVVFPAYVVIGHLLCRSPRWAACLFLGVCGVLMGLYTVLFAAGYGTDYRILY